MRYILPTAPIVEKVEEALSLYPDNGINALAFLTSFLERVPDVSVEQIFAAMAQCTPCLRPTIENSHVVFYAILSQATVDVMRLLKTYHIGIKNVSVEGLCGKDVIIATRDSFVPRLPVSETRVGGFTFSDRREVKNVTD